MSPQAEQSRREQGLPPVIEDPVGLARIVKLLDLVDDSDEQDAA